MFDFFSSERTILYSHHEHFDGSGYPDGLKGSEIPMAARIFALVDAFVAMVAPVMSGNRLSKEEIREELEKHSGKQFDPFLVTMLLQAVEEMDFFETQGGEDGTESNE